MKIVIEHDDDYNEDLEVLEVGNESIVIAYNGIAADTGMCLEEMTQAGLLGEHAPSGMQYVEDFGWVYRDWNRGFKEECEIIDDFLATAASVPVAC